MSFEEKVVSSVLLTLQSYITGEMEYYFKVPIKS